MMRTLAILPVKTFAESKERLTPELNPGPRRALVEAMFADVLVALRRSAVDEVLVVTADDRAQQIAAGQGAGVLEAPDHGHNSAAALGIGAALEASADRALLVPGDCPLLAAAHLDELISRRAGARSALIVPDRHGIGTNALLLSPPASVAPAFGPGSFARHAANAASAGVEHEVVHVPSLALDIDVPEDLALLQETLAATHGGAANTRGMLRQMLRSQA